MLRDERLRYCTMSTDDTVRELAYELLAIRERLRPAPGLSPLHLEMMHAIHRMVFGPGAPAPKPAPGVDPEAHRRLGEHLAANGHLPVDPAADQLVAEWIAEQPQPKRQRLYSEEEVRKAVGSAIVATKGDEAVCVCADCKPGMVEAVLRRLRGEGGAEAPDHRSCDCNGSPHPWEPGCPVFPVAS